MHEFIIQSLRDNVRGAVFESMPKQPAFGSRAMPYLMEFNSSWTEAGDTDANIAWTRKVWGDMAAPFLIPAMAGYLNMTCYNEHGESLVKEAYGVKLPAPARGQAKIRSRQPVPVECQHPAGLASFSECTEKCCTL